MQRIPPIRPVMRRSYINLDALFGHIFSNLTGEPLTPTRIATFYLLRLLFEKHFGKKHVKSDDPFRPDEKGYVFQCLYGLMSLKEELTYKEFRNCIRMFFGENRGITRHFIMAMEQIGCGEADINLYVEDEFYTNKHTKDPNMPLEMYYEEFMLHERRNMPFSTSHSFMYRWMKRLMAQHSKTTEDELFNINFTMRNWVNSYYDEIFLPGPYEKLLPFFIDCSMRSREWISHSLCMIQKNQKYELSYEDMLKFAYHVQKRHIDVYEAFLLEAIIHIQRKDCTSAIRAMKSFFDYTMLDLNENMNHCARTFRLAVPNTVPLLYAPLLNARICRIFGDYETARQLLQESLQQAQLHNEDICHQMANLEILIIEIIGCNPLLEDKPQIVPNNVEVDRRVQRKVLRSIDDMEFYPQPGLPCCAQTEDEFELCCEMDALGKQMMILRMISRGTYKLKTGSLVETGFMCPTMNDYNERNRRIEAFGYGIMTSNLIRNGMFGQARGAASTFLTTNFYGPNDSSCFDMEPWAVVSANLAYSYMAQGNYDDALTTMNSMEEQFPEDLYWQCQRHFVITNAVIHFELIFLQQFDHIGMQYLQELARYSEVEYKLRLALLWASTGKPKEALSMLEKLDTVDPMNKIRIHMQKATILNKLKLYVEAETELAEAVKISDNTTFRNIPAMINRRIALVMISRGKYADACVVLNSCASDIVNYGAYTEKACFFTQLSRCLRFLRKDPRVYLREARALACKKWPTLEKVIIAELAALHAPDGVLPNENRHAQMVDQFRHLTRSNPKRCNWMWV